MSKLKAAKKTATIAVAPNSTPNLTAASSANAPDSVTTCDPQDTAICDLQSCGSKSRKSCTCVISLFIDKCRTSTCEHCGGESRETVWTGDLTDAIDGPEDDQFIDLITSDEAGGGRNGIISRLQIIARQHEYQFCEVREFSLPVLDDYIPLFSGPLPALNLAPPRLVAS